MAPMPASCAQWGGTAEEMLTGNLMVSAQLGTTVKEEPLVPFHVGHLRSRSVGPAHLGTIVQGVLISQLPAQLGP